MFHRPPIFFHLFASRNIEIRIRRKFNSGFRFSPRCRRETIDSPDSFYELYAALPRFLSPEIFHLCRSFSTDFIGCPDILCKLFYGSFAEGTNNGSTPRILCASKIEDGIHSEETRLVIDRFDVKLAYTPYLRFLTACRVMKLRETHSLQFYRALVRRCYYSYRVVS